MRMPILLRMVLLALVCSSSARAEEEFSYVTNNGAITITGYSGAGGAVVVPEEIGGMPVTSVGYHAFYNRVCASVTLPDTVTNIETSAFLECRLTNIVFNEGLRCIGDTAFAQSPNLLNVALPNSVMSIGHHAFSDCYKLTNVSIGSGMTNIGEWSFLWCTNVANFTVDPSNPAFSSTGGVLFNREQTALLLYPIGGPGAYVIPGTVRAIGPGAFFPARSLISVTIPEGVLDIGDSAFQLCSALTSITLPAGLTNIGELAFGACSSLTSITIPDRVITIGDHAFGGCENISNFSFGAKVASIGRGALYGCGVTNLLIPASVTYIGDTAFQRCYELSGIYFRGYPPARGSDLFKDDKLVRGYYLPETEGLWEDWWILPMSVWRPLIQPTDGSFGVRTNGFGFKISWEGSRVVVVEACDNPGDPTWLPLRTNILSNGFSYFSDTEWTNYSRRLYRVRWP